MGELCSLPVSLTCLFARSPLVVQIPAHLELDAKSARPAFQEGLDNPSPRESRLFFVRGKQAVDVDLVLRADVDAAIGNGRNGEA